MPKPSVIDRLGIFLETAIPSTPAYLVLGYWAIAPDIASFDPPRLA